MSKRGRPMIYHTEEDRIFAKKMYNRRYNLKKNRKLLLENELSQTNEKVNSRDLRRSSKVNVQQPRGIYQTVENVHIDQKGFFKEGTENDQ